MTPHEAYKPNPHANSFDFEEAIRLRFRKPETQTHRPGGHVLGSSENESKTQQQQTNIEKHESEEKIKREKKERNIQIRNARLQAISQNLGL